MQKLRANAVSPFLLLIRVPVAKMHHVTMHQIMASEPAVGVRHNT
ncbi:hypothetical protein [Yoonia sp. SS1-5]|uniref:Uncharacterized protein n=1 Tax=Yoonia rhodophyticola TaxID=3137370 RepID=A0AAN0M870_9RHOB